MNVPAAIIIDAIEERGVNQFRRCSLHQVVDLYSPDVNEGNIRSIVRRERTICTCLDIGRRDSLNLRAVDNESFNSAEETFDTNTDNVSSTDNENFNSMTPSSLTSSRTPSSRTPSGASTTSSSSRKIQTPTPTDPGRLTQCENCGKIFKISGLNNHLRSCLISPRVCSTCGQVFNMNLKKFVQHTKNCHVFENQVIL